MLKHSLLLLTLMTISLPHFAGERVIPHQDRNTPKVIFKDEATHHRAKTARLAAENYLVREWQRFELAPQGRNLILERTQNSLLGTHFHYRQYLNGLPVEKATFVITVDKANRISKIYNNTFPVKQQVAAPPANLINGDDALQISWSEVGVSGELVTPPEATLGYRFHENNFQLVYRTILPVSEPLGRWKLALDPLSGRVLEMENVLGVHKHGRGVAPAQPRDHLNPRGGEIRDFYEAMHDLDQRMAKREARANFNKRRVNGTGNVFDPDPRTTLLDFTLDDDVSEAVVSAAYQNVTLRDITQTEEGIFELKGPYVQIEKIIGTNFGPDTDVVNTADGNWDFSRGNDGFNSATVYYHVDKNQRYLHKLGFGDIREGGIMADIDAWGGADNSFFFFPNSLAFGKGGVDDSEDADVILHEYGHAIQQSLVPTWDVRGDGDEGGMGEGFGDYWAGTYSLYTPNGYKGSPNLMFSWDGHNEFWNGRRLDRLDLTYNPNVDHDDHQCLVPFNECFTNGGESDELWSAPLFQSQLELFRRGYPLQELDRVVIQSHFGIGDSVKMHDMSAATINTAVALQPHGPHAEILQNFFAQVSIEQPKSSYSYIAPHIPFCQVAEGSDTCGQVDGFWYSWIEIANPGTATANVTLETYVQGDAQGYLLLDTQNVQVEAGSTFTFLPPSDKQRWVRVTSDLPLGGSQYFERTGLQANEGTEKAAIPLITEHEVANELILPHIPANREGFWSGSVVVNITDTTQTLQITPIGENGTDLSDQFPAESLSYQFAPYEKYISFITPVNGSAALVDDSALTEKVSYLKLTSTGEIAAFELFGYNAQGAELATTGVVAQPNQDRAAWSIRTALADVDWNGFTILNPDDQTHTLQISVYDEQGTLAQSVETSISPRTKLLGLNTNFGGFNFPSNAQAVLSFADPGQAATVVIQSQAPLRIFDLSGDLANTTIDGGAVRGLTTKTAFTHPRGELRLMQAVEPETVTVDTYTRDGDNLLKTSATYTLQAGETRVLPIDGTPETIVVRGAFVNPSVITREADRNVLTVRNGHQIALDANGN